MKVLHVYPESDQLIKRHVMMLSDGLRQSADVYTAGNSSAARQQIKERQPDIVHVHGCSQFFLIRTLRQTYKSGIRAVITLHGQLEPWAMQQQNAYLMPFIKGRVGLSYENMDRPPRADRP